MIACHLMVSCPCVSHSARPMRCYVCAESIGAMLGTQEIRLTLIHPTPKFVPGLHYAYIPFEGLVQQPRPFHSLEACADLWWHCAAALHHAQQPLCGTITAPGQPMSCSHASWAPPTSSQSCAPPVCLYDHRHTRIPCWPPRAFVLQLQDHPCW
jgi:hypothetical protein